MTDGPDLRFVDPSRTCCLCEVGLPGWLAATVVDPDGPECLWLLNLSDLPGHPGHQGATP